jgi:hypothetical protein
MGLRAGSDISDGAQIYPIKLSDMLLEPDGGRINLAGRIYLTWAGCQVSRIRWRPDKSGWSDISDLGSDMSNLG